MEKNILVFSKYFGYSVGGAEKSTFELLKQEEVKGNKITVVIVRNLNTFNAQNLKMDFPKTWKIKYIDFKTDSIRFTYFNYYINKTRVRSFFSNLPETFELWSYGFYAPAAINAFKGSTVYLARDEFGLGWNSNYFKGLKFILKQLYIVVEYFWYTKWRRELKLTVQKSQLIANSRFISEELAKISPLNDIKIIYPRIDELGLVEAFKQIKPQKDQGLVLIGDNIIKGNDIFIKLSKEYPNEFFYIFDRKYNAVIKKDNLIYMPWQKNAAELYSYAKLIIAPSRWAEAYGRIVAEAQILGIKVIASNRGGIPEVMKNKNNLVNILDNLDEWKEKIENNL